MSWILGFFTGPYATLIKAGLIAAAVTLVAGAGAYRMHKHDMVAYNQLKQDFDVFKGGVAALGRAAQDRKVAQEKSDKERKEKADAESKKDKSDLAGLYDAYASLRNQRKNSDRSVLPGAGAATGGTTLLTFDRAALDKGLGAADDLLQGGATKSLRRGDEAIGALNTAKRWAQEK